MELIHNHNIIHNIVRGICEAFRAVDVILVLEEQFYLTQ